ncbi:LiaI-LiaF-like domain-containing protein [Lutispora thermophila]|uniref:LiaI-LiaF-like transmembrane region domain-containing protein n=1 Tax=Lutispora thermophila DSM 19022 TaxID=1122184 RepID=A0A1M6HY60_9FIRM|nr:DUF5668 domain-containing protein [Lutispora thermophila]SHJ27170.1 hypothetical protein SAMN02745176_02987 [Lutispora thermophila DSM 19022]
MNGRRYGLGVVLILIGLSALLKNLKIMPDNSFVIFVGIFFMYLWYIKRNNILLLLGCFGVFSGLISLLDYYNIIRLKMSLEMVLLILGIIFLYLYYSKGIFGFVFPGAILISLAGYVFLISRYNSEKLWPSYFILMGFAFYLIYFIAFYEKSSWTLVLGTILNLLGILFLGFTYGIISWRIYKYYDFLWPLIMIVAGLLLLMVTISGKRY